MSQTERLYGDLAWLWPLVSPPEEYVSEANEFLRVIRKHARRQVDSLLDLGCGAGHNDATLQQYFQVTGVDLSQPMLEQARRLVPDALFLQDDMRSLELEQRFDAVIVANSIGYMLDEADLLAAFRTAYKHLKPGGVFCTYAEETPERWEQNGVYSETFHQGDLDVVMVENYFDPDLHDTTYEITFIYLIRKKGELRIETDHHKNGIFPVDTWIRLLKEAGFQVKMDIFHVLEADEIQDMHSLGTVHDRQGSQGGSDIDGGQNAPGEDGFPFFIGIRPE